MEAILSLPLSSQPGFKTRNTYSASTTLPTAWYQLRHDRVRVLNAALSIKLNFA